VATEKAAREIFNTVAASIETPAHRKRHYSIVTVVDNGKTWSVFEEQKNDRMKFTSLPNGQERVEATAGGGGLSLEIDKCTGTIVQASYMK